MRLRHLLRGLSGPERSTSIRPRQPNPDPLRALDFALEILRGDRVVATAEAIVGMVANRDTAPHSIILILRALLGELPQARDSVRHRIT